MLSPRRGTSVLGIWTHRGPESGRAHALRSLTMAMGALAAAGCAHAPATSELQQPTARMHDVPVSPQQEAQHQKQEVERAVGIYDDARLAEYVSSVGRAMAVKAEQQSLPWSFEVIDDAAVNAFALPDGSVFVTRGLLTHLNSEAELSAVLGHEMAHVTAKHAPQAMSQQELADLGLGFGP